MSGTMLSPWPPSTKAVTSSTDDVELVGEEKPETRAVEHARHADDHLLGQAAGLLQRPDHGVERIGDADHEGAGRVFLDAGADLLHHLEVDAEKIVAAHAGLARHAGGDDADAGAVDRVVGIGAGEMGVEAVDRRGLDEIERLALGNAFGDVEQHDVAELLEADEMGERAADLAGTDQCNLGTRHVGRNLGCRAGGRSGCDGVIDPFGAAVQAGSIVL